MLSGSRALFRRGNTKTDFICEVIGNRSINAPKTIYRSLNMDNRSSSESICQSLRWRGVAALNWPNSH
jgi:hypothetical protein